MSHNYVQLHPKITTAHQAKWAYVYIRQSSLSQVVRHAESTDLQYNLVERAIQLGWPRERVKLIDEDLGKSGASTEFRSGFQHLIAEIGLARVGLVLSWDASRLARNSSDWYQLLELCSLFGTLIADGEGVYNPQEYHDRLLLGLSGMMSEAELHHIQTRLLAGMRHKAERGELPIPLPVGLVRLPSGEVVFHPDEEVQNRIHLVFAKFKELGTAHAIVRYLRREELLLPSRPIQGPAPYKTIWRAATVSNTLRILKNPAYAGAYAYGRTKHDPTHRKPGQPTSGVVRLPMDQWAVLIQDRFPAYITWDEFIANQAQLAANHNTYKQNKPGAPRKGAALLQGIALCGQCGTRMQLRYSGPQGQYPFYYCFYPGIQTGRELSCQQVGALLVDEEIERLLLAALEPDKVEVALAALEQLEQEYATLKKQWQLRLERARYEAERAQRQYNAVEPENRLVARTLESQWEGKLRDLEKVEQAYEQWQQQNRLELTAEDRQDILALAENLPTIWCAATTTAPDKKRLLRLLIKEVILDQTRETGKVWFQINWQTGAISQHWLLPRVSSYEGYAYRAELQQRIEELVDEYQSDEKIAAILNEEGFRTARKSLFEKSNVWAIRHKWGIPAGQVRSANRLRWEDGSYTGPGAAAVIGVGRGAIYRWLKMGRIQGKQPVKGGPWKIPLTEAEIAALRAEVEQFRLSRDER